MNRSPKTVTMFLGACAVGVFLGVTSPVAQARADVLLDATSAMPVRQSQQEEPPPDPKKKKPGEACKSSDECQKHHTCTKVDDKKVCQAPARRELPPGAVT